MKFTDEDWERISMFAAAALSGVCANPAYNDPTKQRIMQSQGITPEAVAVNSAINTYEMLVRVRAEFDKKSNLTVTDGGKK